jgi:hypothetical protein
MATQQAGNVVRLVIVFLCACVCITSLSNAQPASEVGTSLPPIPSALQALGAQIDESLMQSKYEGLDKLGRRAASTLAVSAAMITDSGRCADPSASGSAAETLLFTFDGIGRKVYQPILDLPDKQKSLLIDFAMDVEAKRQSAQDLTSLVCHDKILPDSAAKPLAERRAAARQVLSLTLFPPKPVS